MNAIRSEKIESIEEDSNLAAVSEVEAGIRDFVRNDVAYLRRPGTTVSTAENALEPNTEATVNNVNSLIQRVAGTSLAEIDCCMPKVSASSAKSPAMPSSARPR
jgi:hypothetical protein